MLPRINQSLDETSNEKALTSAQLRSLVRDQLESGRAPRDIAPTMSPKTVINFAYGHTKSPSSTTTKILAEKMGLRQVYVPKDHPPIPGEID